MKQDTTIDNPFFIGFHRSHDFETTWHRLQQLELWMELAIRPVSRDDCCHPDDQRLWDKETDDLAELQRHCLHVRQLLNKQLPPIQQGQVPDEWLVPNTSQIPGAGKGLYFQPAMLPQQEDPRTVVSPHKNCIPKGTVICYYTGHLHNHQSSRLLKDKSYLMMMMDLGNVLVDPGPLPHIKARYINDPLHEDAINCQYVPEELRAAVVATRDIQSGEELFASYGDFYWSQHPTMGKVWNGGVKRQQPPCIR